jgi:hypothetical protein
MTTTSEKLSFIDLACKVLEKEQKALSVDEIWDMADKAGLTGQLGSVGKTPKATLGSRLYTGAKEPTGIFAKVGFRPAKFVLKSLLKTIPKEALEQQLSETPATPTKNVAYAEKDLHPVMVCFANSKFGPRCKTICHEKSVKSGQKHNEWLHPDMVGFTLTTEEWHPAVVHLAQNCGASTAKLYSFELKIVIDFPTLRASFFQAVSNSSWAHEGYLVAAQVQGDPLLRDELERLSQSFGIGVIQLDIENPDASEILYPAHEKPELDWKTIDRITKANVDFTDFIAAVQNSIKINQFADKSFDAVLGGNQLNEYLKKFIPK